MTLRDKFFEHDGKRITYREAEVILAYAKGYTIQETADVLFISYSTVKTHRENIRARFTLQGYNTFMYFAIQLQTELEKSVDIPMKISRKAD